MAAVEEEAVETGGVTGAVVVRHDHRLAVRVLLGALGGDGGRRQRPVPQARHHTHHADGGCGADQRAFLLAPLGFRRQARLFQLLLLFGEFFPRTQLSGRGRAWLRRCRILELDAPACWAVGGYFFFFRPSLWRLFCALGLLDGLGLVALGPVAARWILF